MAVEWDVRSAGVPVERAGTVVYDCPEALVFTIVDTGTPGSKYGVKRLGILQPMLEWRTERTNP